MLFVLYIANAQKKKIQYICLSEEEAVKRKDINLLTSKLTSHDSSLFYMRHKTRGESSAKLATFILSRRFFLSLSFLNRTETCEGVREKDSIDAKRYDSIYDEPSFLFAADAFAFDHVWLVSSFHLRSVMTKGRTKRRGLFSSTTRLEIDNQQITEINQNDYIAIILMPRWFASSVIPGRIRALFSEIFVYFKQISSWMPSPHRQTN